MIQRLNFRPCKACGCKIAFVKNQQTGKHVPVHRVATVYLLQYDGTMKPVLRGQPQEQWLISHFEICPNPDRFSKKTKEA